MNLCVMNPVLAEYSFEDALKYLHSLGVDSMEIGAGGYPGDNHLKAEEIIGNPDKAKAYLDLMAKYDIKIAAICCHGNPLHPNKQIAADFDKQFKNAILAAEMLDVHTIIGFAGCPGTVRVVSFTTAQMGRVRNFSFSEQSIAISSACFCRFCAKLPKVSRKKNRTDRREALGASPNR